MANGDKIRGKISRNGNWKDLTRTNLYKRQQNQLDTASKHPLLSNETSNQTTMNCGINKNIQHLYFSPRKNMNFDYMHQEQIILLELLDDDQDEESPKLLLNLSLGPKSLVNPSVGQNPMFDCGPIHGFHSELLTFASMVIKFF